MFTEAELAKLVADTVPADRTHAVVLDVDRTGAAITVKMTKDEHWEVDAIFRRDWSGSTNAEAKVVYSW
jgi:hypothetical protein